MTPDSRSPAPAPDARKRLTLIAENARETAMLDALDRLFDRGGTLTIRAGDGSEFTYAIHAPIAGAN